MLSVLNTKDLVQPFTRWFVYGDTGAGKTTFASTFPRPLFLVPQTENSVTTLAGKNFPYITINSRSGKYKAGVGGLDAVLQLLIEWYNKDPNSFPYDTIVCESVTHYMELVIDELTQGNKVVMDVGRYGQLAGHMRNVHQLLSGMDVHLIYTALGRVDDKTSKGEPYLPGKTGDLLPSACEVYAHIEEKNNGKDKPRTFELYTQTHGIWPARTRLNRLPVKTVNPTWAKFAPFINNIETPTAQVPPANEQVDATNNAAVSGE